MHAATHLTPVSQTRLWAGRIMHAHLPEGEKIDWVYLDLWQELTQEQRVANQELHQRRLRIDHVHRLFR